MSTFVCRSFSSHVHGHHRSKSSYNLINTNTHIHARESLDFLCDMRYKPSTCKALQDMCIMVIIDHFESFVKCYYANEDENNKKLEFIFLKKGFSQTIFEILSYERKLQKSYLPFLINQYMKDLDLSSYPYTDVVDLLPILKEIGHAILRLNLSGVPWKYKKSMELLSTLPNLQMVHFDFTRKYKNDVLGILPKKCPLINHISLSHNDWVTDRSLHFLCTLSETDDIIANPTIEDLDLTGTQVSVEGIIFALQYFPSLKSLKNRYVAQALHVLHCNDLVEKKLGNLRKYGLKEIDIYADLDILEVLEICTELCPNVTNLFVNQISAPIEMDFCMRFSSLKVANLVFNRHNELILPAEFFNLYASTLEMLTIAYAKFSVTCLVNCKKLTFLNLTATNFEEFKESSLHSPNFFPHLSHLELKNYDLSESNTLNCVLLILSLCPVLSKLTFHQAYAFPNYAMDQIAKIKCIKNLSVLDLSFSIIKSSGLERLLLVFAELKRLVIECCDIPDTTYRTLRERYPITEIIWNNDWIY